MVSNFHLDDNTITVDCAASEVRGKFVVDTAKTGENRVGAILELLATMLAQHVERYPSIGRLRVYGQGRWRHPAPQFVPAALQARHRHGPGRGHRRRTPG